MSALAATLFAPRTRSGDLGRQSLVAAPSERILSLGEAVGARLRLEK